MSQHGFSWKKKKMQYKKIILKSYNASHKALLKFCIEWTHYFLPYCNYQIINSLKKNQFVLYCEDPVWKFKNVYKTPLNV